MPLQELAVLKGVSLTLLRNLTNKQSRHPAFGGKPMPFVKEAHRWARRGTVITRIVVKARGSTVDKYLTWRDRKATPVEWLGRELSAGPKWRADVIAAAANAGFSVSPIQCAARELGVRSQRSNNDAHRSVTGTFAKGSGRTCAQWSLPDHIAAKYGDTGQQPAAEVEKIAADARAKSDPADKIMDNAARERAYLSPRDLADEFGVPFDALRMRLNRFRGQNHKGWIENPNRGSREPEFLYQVKAIQMIVHELQPKRP